MFLLLSSYPEFGEDIKTGLRKNNSLRNAHRSSQVEGLKSEVNYPQFYS